MVLYKYILIHLAKSDFLKKFFWTYLKPERILN